MIALRPAGILLASALAAVLAAGCGGGSGGGGSSSPSAATGARVSPLEYANAVNLRASDLPGFTSTPHHETADDRRFSAELARCVGTTPETKARADVHSPDFKRGSGLSTQQVTSAVEVVSSPSVAQHDIAAVRTARARSCIETFLDRSLIAQAGGQVKFTGNQIAPLPVPGNGVSGVGYRITLSGQAAGTPLRFVADLLAFASGPSEVTLTALGIGQPFPSADESRLYTALVNRAQRQRV